MFWENCSIDSFVNRQAASGTSLKPTKPIDAAKTADNKTKVATYDRVKC